MATASSTQPDDGGFSAEYSHEIAPYRAVSKAAVLSLFFGLLGLLAILFPTLLFLPLAGSFLGVIGLRIIGRYPDEVTGYIPGLLGTMLSLGVFIGGSITHTVIYLTEVPEGYTRISFSQLQPNADIPGQQIPVDVDRFNAEQVFVKGYVHPSVLGMGPVNQFVLVPDMGTCCFGGQPKLTDMIEVTTNGPLTVKYSTRRRRLAGTFEVDGKIKPVNGLGGVYYRLSADYVK
ncbi:MAG: hypothetical protein QGG36_15870 [Pirellulaceae bacterium]|nr:hypothetical protein [Pirellulaceae bacterium]MDP7017282.1 hypothetical protein [Pirellulaceae bacterium]